MYIVLSIQDLLHIYIYFPILHKKIIIDNKIRNIILLKRNKYNNNNSDVYR